MAVIGNAATIERDREERRKEEKLAHTLYDTPECFDPGPHGSVGRRSLDEWQAALHRAVAGRLLAF